MDLGRKNQDSQMYFSAKSWKSTEDDLSVIIMNDVS